MTDLDEHAPAASSRTQLPQHDAVGRERPSAAQSIFQALYDSLSPGDRDWIDERLAAAAQREREAAEHGVIIPLVRAESTSRELRGPRRGHDAGTTS